MILFFKNHIENIFILTRKLEQKLTLSLSQVEIRKQHCTTKSCDITITKIFVVLSVLEASRLSLVNQYLTRMRWCLVPHLGMDIRSNMYCNDVWGLITTHLLMFLDSNAIDILKRSDLLQTSLKKNAPRKTLCVESKCYNVKCRITYLSLIVASLN